MESFFEQITPWLILEENTKVKTQVVGVEGNILRAARWKVKRLIFENMDLLRIIRL
jgi:hypothetical protein